MRIKSIDTKNLKFYFLLILICLIVFSNSFNNKFMMDDYSFILQDRRTHDIKNILLSFSHDLQAQPRSTDVSSGVFYRPMINIISTLNYVLFGNKPLGYRIINFVLYFLACFSLFNLIRFIFKDEALAMISTLLFSVHPLNGLMINYITANIFSVQIIAMSYGLILFILAFDRKKVIYYFICGGIFIIAVLCHETSFAFPFYLFVTLYLLRNISFKEAFIKCLPYFILLVLIIQFRLEYASLKTSILDNVWAERNNWQILGATFSKLIFVYLGQLIFPVGIVMIKTIPFVTKHIILWNLVLLSLGVILLCFWGLRRKYPLIIWTISVFSIGFLPVSMACFLNLEQGLVLEGHWLYFSSIGFFIITASCFKFFKRRFNYKIVFIVFYALLGCFGLLSYQMNDIWEDQKTYSEFWVKQNPEFTPALYYLANAYFTNGQNTEAEELYNKILLKRKDDWHIFNDLGLIAKKEGNLDKAEKNLLEALALNPTSGATNNNIGTVYYERGDNNQAEEYFKAAINYNPYFIEPRLNLAKIYRHRKEYDKAERLYNDNLQINKNDNQSLYELISVYFLNHNQEKAIEKGKMFLEKNKDPVCLVNLGSLFAQNKYTNMAFAFYSKALSLDQNYPEAYLELGKLYGNLEKFDKAIVVWQDGLRIAPTDERFKELIMQAQELKINLGK